MDLISRAKLVDLAKSERKTCGKDYDFDGLLSDIENAPTVPAVPLDKLCEWLEKNATMDCDGCRATIGSCEDDDNDELVCNTRERWKIMLTKWMEEQDAAD